MKSWKREGIVRPHGAGPLARFVCTLAFRSSPRDDKCLKARTSLADSPSILARLKEAWKEHDEIALEVDLAGATAVLERPEAAGTDWVDFRWTNAAALLMHQAVIEKFSKSATRGTGPAAPTTDVRAQFREIIAYKRRILIFDLSWPP